MTTPDDPPSARPARVGGFRRWRRSRPFWGGLLLILAGIELLLSGNSSLGGITIRTGPEGFLSYVLPALLLLCGLLSWLTPAQRIFYAIIGALTALYALIGLNLGGWFLGTLIGLVGSAMIFGWGPTASETAADGDLPLPQEPNAGEPEYGPDEPGYGPDAGEPEYRPDGPDAPDVAAPGRHAAGRAPTRDEAGPPAQVETRQAGHFNGGTALALLPLLLAGSVALAVAAAPRPGYADATPTPAPTTPATQPADTSQPSLPPAATGPPAPPTGQPTLEPRTPTAGSTGTASPTPVTRTLQPAPGTPSVPPASTAPGQGVVSRVPAVLSASVLTPLAFSFDGIATLPTASGPLATLKFTMDEASDQGFALMIGDASRSVTIKGELLVAQGHVTLYTTSFSAKLLGAPLTFTPDSPPPPVLPPAVVFTDVSLNLVYLECDLLKISSMRETGTG
jgi:hypothetical protein